MTALGKQEHFALSRSKWEVQSSATEPDIVYLLIEPSGATPFDLGAEFLNSPAFVIRAKGTINARRILQEKSYWPVGSLRSQQRWHPPTRFDVFQEDLGLSGDGIATMSPWAALWKQPELEPEPEAEVEESAVRGVFAPRHERKFLFSQELDLKTAELPRHRPFIRINPWRVPSIDE